MTRLPENISWAPRPEQSEPQHRAPRLPWDAFLLLVLFGPHVRPTARGLRAARVALALCAVAAVLIAAWVLGATADAIVDPTPELPA